MPAHKKAPQEVAARCHACGASSRDWLDYFCPVCGELNEQLYRNEHDSPNGKALNLSDIKSEYAAAGIPFAHNPNYLGAEAVLSFLRGEPRDYQRRA